MSDQREPPAPFGIIWVLVVVLAFLGTGVYIARSAKPSDNPSPTPVAPTPKPLTSWVSDQPVELDNSQPVLMELVQGSTNWTPPARCYIAEPVEQDHITLVVVQDGYYVTKGAMMRVYQYGGWFILYGRVESVTDVKQERKYIVRLAVGQQNFQLKPDPNWPPKQ